jgi:secondary thiamine-phosphate synthase enzyme
VIRFELKTDRRDQLVDITEQIEDACRELGLERGAVLVHVPHTTAGVMMNEGYDPAVAEDVLGVLGRFAPADAGYAHLEGNSDSHAKAIAAGCSQLVPVESGRPALGRWQRIFFCEFDGPRHRQVWVTPLRG